MKGREVAQKNAPQNLIDGISALHGFACVRVIDVLGKTKKDGHRRLAASWATWPPAWLLRSQLTTPIATSSSFGFTTLWYVVHRW